MTSPRRLLSLAAVALAGAVLAGCGSSDKAPPGNRVHGQTLSIYASLPYIGVDAAEGDAALDGARMALAAVGGRIGRYRIVLHALDDATISSHGWDPGQTTINARAAILDPTTIGYVGDLNSGATAIALPLLSRAGVPQISPTSTAVGLTEASQGASPGEPQKYYPTNVRTFARVVPNDGVQAAVQVAIQRSAGCRSTFVLDDGEVDGNDAASSFVAAAAAAHLTVAADDQYLGTATNYTSMAQTAVKSHAECVLISADAQNHAVALTEAVAAAMPEARLFATSELAVPAFVDPADGGVSPTVATRLLLTMPMLAGGMYPPGGRRFLTAYGRRYGRWEPDAIFGYEAMSLMLNAVSRATGGGRRQAVRSRVIHEIFATRNRHSVLGTYSIDRQGDTTLNRFGVYRIEDGRLVFVQALAG